MGYVHVGAVLASKTEFATRDDATRVAHGLVSTWNECLSGSVYGLVCETFDAEKTPLDDESTWGYIGYCHALAELDWEGACTAYP